MVGGTLTDLDAPIAPTAITRFRVTPEEVWVIGEDFEFGGLRKYASIRPTHRGDGSMEMSLYMLAAILTPPARTTRTD